MGSDQKPPSPRDGATGPGSHKEKNPAAQDAATRRPRRWLSISIFALVILLALVLHRCENETPPWVSVPRGGNGSAPPDTSRLPPAVPVVPAPPAESIASTPHRPAPVAAKTRPVKPGGEAAKKDSLPRGPAPVDSGPYIYADPWGGRHFDSVRVTLHCRENCVLLYSLEDSVHFKSYDTPFVFRRNTTLWISGIDSLNRQVGAIRVDYIIERNPGSCSEGTMPMDVKGKTVCMDVYEWPNQEGETPRAFVSQKGAADSCAQAGKRLCTLDEWREGCRGPDQAAYPYGSKYNENYCPAKENGAARAGRFPVCRSYYGTYDMTGNLWEWTSTPATDPDFYMVAGGNWDGGHEATCSLAKFSFYPKVRYPFVGFRCCRDARKP